MSKAAKKTHWLRTTLVVLVICGLIGTVIAGVKFTHEKAATKAYATLQLSFEGAADGVAPNGNRYDVQDMGSDEVLQTALEAASLSGTYTPEQIRSSLRVQGQYPEDLVEQFTSTETILSTQGNMSLTLSDYHPTTFSVELNNEFDPSVSQAQLTGLLDQILSAYRNYFAAFGANKVEVEDQVFNISDYDYAQQLQIIQNRLDNLYVYAKKMDEEYPAFRYKGKGYNDITVRIDNLEAGDMTRAEAMTTMYALSRDNDRLMKQYQYEIRKRNDQIRFQEEYLKKMDEMAEAYQKNATIYLSTNTALNTISGNSSITYDRLISRRREATEHITQLRKEITEYELKVENLKNTMEAAETETEVAARDAQSEASDAAVQAVKTPDAVKTASADAEVVQRRVNSLEALLLRVQTKTNAIFTDFDAMLQVQNQKWINDQTVSVTAVKYTSPRLLSGAFLKMLIKEAGPFCALGLMVCLMLIFISRWREDKRQKS